ncbi:MAG: septal ring lytic transglycosylase RlpA family protein [bacterium]
MKGHQGISYRSGKRGSRVAVAVFACLVLFSLSATCGNKRNPSQADGDAQVGMASWYGKKFHGKKTASGERFNMFALTAAHKTLPFNSRVKVTNLSNHKSVKVRVNDRGPWAKGRIIDLSYAAAKRIDMIEKGVVKVRVEVISRP